MVETKKHKVLIVDDDKFLLDMYSMKFAKSSFDVDIAVGGEEALNKLREGKIPDVMLLDLVMPAMDGIELLETIRKENLAKDSVVIILSNQNQASDIERAKKLNVASYIVKASSIPSEVVAQVTRVIDSLDKGK